MKYASYTGTIRNNLCELLTSRRDNREKIIKLNESIEIIMSAPFIERPVNFDLTISELSSIVEFFEKINSDYGVEVMRLTKILLGNNIECNRRGHGLKRIKKILY